MPITEDLPIRVVELASAPQLSMVSALMPKFQRGILEEGDGSVMPAPPGLHLQKGLTYPAKASRMDDEPGVNAMGQMSGNFVSDVKIAKAKSMEVAGAGAEGAGCAARTPNFELATMIVDHISD